MSQQCSVTFQPRSQRVYVLPGTKILEAIARTGRTIDTPCGGKGTCGKCRVQVLDGPAEPTDADRRIFSAQQLAEGWRLACQTAVTADLTVHVPAASYFADQHQILTAAGQPAEELCPSVRKVYVQLDEPSLADNAADLLRLEQATGAVRAEIGLLRDLPALLRAGGFAGTAVVTDHRLIDFEPGDTRTENYGVAVDVGTTTVAASLLELSRGEELAVAAAMNPQVTFGEDVLSRIHHSMQGPAERDGLRQAIRACIAELVDRLCHEAGVKRERIYEIALAGNTTMQHLACGLDVAAMGQVPFVPVCARGLVLPAAEMQIPIHPRAPAYVLPVIGGFVGGDTVAGILVAGLANKDGASLMVDVGTNGEIVVARDGRLWAASAAAGPAFEGARIACGMRAAAGAIEKVVFDDDVRLGVIGQPQPVGLCGSGLIDLAAELLTAGLVTPTGRMLPPDQLPADLPPALRSRVRLGDSGQVEFVLAGRADAQGDVVLTQRDVRELQLAAGAIRAGVAILLRRAGVEAGDVRRVLIAGGFGSFIRRSNAQKLGLFPGDIPHERIRYIGNASLNGAKWVLLSMPARKRAEEAARRTQHVNLSQDPDFQSQFAEAMLFPPPPPR